MSSELADIFRNTIVGGLKRQAITTCSKWARTYRYMSASELWVPDEFPWTLEMHNSTAARNVGQKSAQMGFTETALNITLFKIDIEALDCLYVLPTRTPDASEFSAARFDSALELSPHLANLFSNVKNVGHKRAGSANLYIRGSNSRSSLKSIPVAFIVFDEVNEMNQENIPLAEERTSGQTDPIIWKISTPTVPGKGISGPFENSTQEHYVFKCPHCHRWTELVWPDSVIITAEHQNDPKIKNTHLICKECDGILPHKTKKKWLGIDNAHWEPFGNPNNETRGYHINQFYSIKRQPWEIAVVYFKSLIDKPSEQEFFNSKLGLPHIVAGSKVEEYEVTRAMKRGTRKKSDPISNNTIITMGVDQGRWLHYEIAAWHFPNLGNDLNMIARCEVLTEGKCVDFSELDTLMKQFQVLKCVIDAQPDRRLAYEFACRFWGHVSLCFYGRSQQAKTISIDPSDDQHKITVDRTSWLDVALNRFHIDTIDLPNNTSLEYIEQIQNIVKRYRKDANDNPIGEYINIGADHFAHARCYSEIALPLAASLHTNQNVRIYL